MLNLVPYLIKLSISLSVVYLFYQLLLRRLTFYNSNRWYLLLYTMICFFIPFVNTGLGLQRSPIVQYIPSIEQITVTQTGAPITSAAFSLNLMYLVIVVAGMVFMLIKCLAQFYSLFRLRSKAKLLYGSSVKLYHIDKPVIPFSFGNAIYINQHQHSQQELSDIIRHEFIHVKQRHTVDIIWGELLCIVNWYNPFAWLLRKAIRQNLEFIADHQVLKTGLDRKQYQYLLLKVIGTTRLNIANNFNFSSIKKRIAMMNKTKSARVNLLRFLFILPLMVVILLAFRDVVHPQQEPVSKPTPVQPNALPVIIDTALVSGTSAALIPNLNSPSLVKAAYVSDKVVAYLNAGQKDTVPAKVTDTARKAFVFPSDITSIGVSKEKNSITITLKNGESDTYVLTDPKDRAAFKSKYGGDLPDPGTQLRIVPPPVAPVPGAPAKAPAAAAAPVSPAGVTTPVQPVVLKLRAVEGHPPSPAVEGQPAPVQSRNDDCFNNKGYCITVADNGGECVVIVKNRRMKIIEAALLEEWNSNKRYEDKYGPILPAVKKALK